MLKEEFRKGFKDILVSRKFGPEVEGILFDPKTPFDVPSVERLASFFDNIAMKHPNLSLVYEELLIDNKVVCNFPTGAKMYLNNYEVDITTDMSRCTFEITVPPSSRMEKLEKNVKEILEIVMKGAEDTGLMVLGLGCHPFAKRSFANVMPKRRYKLMGMRYHEKELLGLSISAASQVHVEINNAESGKILNLLNGFVPVLIASTSNSTIVEAELSGYKAYREIAWDEHTSKGSIEKERIGIPRIFRNLDSYFDYLADQRMIISRRHFEGNSTYVLFGKESPKVSEFTYTNQARVYRMDNGKIATVGPDIEDIRFLESTIWPDVRLRSRFGTAEFRACDFQPSTDELLAIISALTGVVRNSERAAHALEDYNLDEIRLARKSAIEEGFSGMIKDQKLSTFARKMIHIAYDGLEKGERRFLVPILRNIEEAKSPADRTRDFLRDELKGGIRSASDIGKFVDRHKFRI